jgi:DNA replication and repair protein RecF
MREVLDPASPHDLTIAPRTDSLLFPVRLNHLSLTNFRNYSRLELNLPDRLTVLQGDNAQGKTNLLEAIHLLATGRSPRATAERELISWLALDGPLSYARLEADMGEGREAQRLELVLELAPPQKTRDCAAANGGNGPAIRKQVRINGVAKRALDLVGRLRMVLFLPEDIGLVAGAPGERRRYLDIALCQIAPTYCRALGEYNRVLAQRNALLKRLRDEGGDPGQLTFWDERMAEQGSVLLHQRSQAVRDLDRIAAGLHGDLTGGAERLRLVYLPALDLEPAAGGTPRNSNGKARMLREGAPAYHARSRDELWEQFAAQLRRTRARELAAGISLLGPHRDDVAFSVDGRDLRAYGSRGQQRTGALALKMAEVQMMREAVGESPLLLLDDVMSELDAPRRQMLLEALAGVAQAIVTTTDWSDFSPELLAQARRLRVEGGRLLPVAAGAFHFPGLPSLLAK